MKKVLVFLILLSGSYNNMYAQEGHSEHEIKGYVFERDARGALQPLPGAHVFCPKEQKGGVTDATGAFVLHVHHPFPHPIIASFVGYESDTIELKASKPIQFVLETVTLDEVQVFDRQKSTAKSLIKAINVEYISGAELQKAACCNLSESFETNPSVDVSFTDALTGAKQIQMLGLDGVYTQILFENMPLLRGLSASYGLGYLPGSWIESIQIAKGTGSVVNGFESLTGQINVELFKPQTADKLFWNTYLSSTGMIENNFVTSTQLKDNWSTAILGHYAYMGRSVDDNKDGFADDPETKRLTFLNRWEYSGFDNRHIAFGFRYLNERKLGGQLRAEDLSSPLYGIDMKTDQAEFHSKTGFIFDKPATSLGIISSLRYHNQETFFGNRSYSGMQHSVYLNAIFQSNFGSDANSYKLGASAYGDRYEETLDDHQLSRNDQTYGLFGEYQMKRGERFSGIVGLRADHNNQWGMWYSPRVHMRFNPIEDMVLRVSAGKAYRQANVLAENLSYFFSSRDLKILNFDYDSLTEQVIEVPADYSDLSAEIAWNYGFNFTYNFYLIGKETSFNADFYQTDFIDQVIVDVEQGNQVRFYNLDGESYSRSLQLDAAFEPADGWELKFAQKWNDSRSTFDGILKEVPFMPTSRQLYQVSYSTWQNKWLANITLQNIGSSRIPAKGDVAEEWSESFKMLSGQVTRKFKRFDWYLGVENALDYTQENPIRSVESPFSEDFDAAMIWGPIMGRRMYSGIRVKFND